MKLYHGSTSIIRHPRASVSRNNLDFGKGFYLTSHVKQAENWAKRKARMKKSTGYVNEYQVVDDLSGYSVLRFDDTDAAWVEFVCDCRRGGQAFRTYDMIIGGVADDRVYFAVDMYYQGIWDIERTLEALRFYEVNNQWCFVSQRAIDELISFVNAWEVQ